MVHSVHFSGMALPFLIRFVIFAIGATAQFRVALYASPGIPSFSMFFFECYVPELAIYVRFRVVLSKPCFDFWSVFIIWVSSVCSLMSCRSSDVLANGFPHSCSSMCSMLGFRLSCSLLKHYFAHSSHLSSVSSIPWHSVPSFFLIATWLFIASTRSLLW